MNLYNKHAKLVCIPSSRAINSFAFTNPGINNSCLPFFNQKIDANAPLKKIPSTIA